jgi:cation transport ATPase
MTARAGAVACTVCEAHTESTYRIEGMDCHEEVQLLERRLGHLPGLEGFTADILNQRLRVTHDAARLSAADVAEAVNATGMRAWLEHERPMTAAGGVGSTGLRLVVLAGAAFGLGFLLQSLGLDRGIVLPAYLVAIAAGGALDPKPGSARAELEQAEDALCAALPTAAVIVAVPVASASADAGH